MNSYLNVCKYLYICWNKANYLGFILFKKYNKPNLATFIGICEHCSDRYTDHWRLYGIETFSTDR